MTKENKQKKEKIEAQAKEIAEKIKTLTPDKLTAKDYQRYKSLKGGTSVAEYHNIKNNIKFSAGLTAVITLVVGVFVGLGFLLPFSFISAAAFLLMDIPWVLFLITNISILNLLELRPEIALFKELKKQKLLGKLEKVLGEYQKLQAQNQQSAQTIAENGLENVKEAQGQGEKPEQTIATATQPENSTADEQIAEPTNRILQKLLHRLKENDANSLYQIEIDAEKHSAVVKPSANGQSADEISNQVKQLADQGIEIKCEN